MERKVKFSGFIGRWDTPSFFITENEPLKITVEVDKILIGKFFLTVLCGDRKITFALRDNIIIPNDMLFGDVLELFLEMRSNEGDRIVIPSAKTNLDKGYYIEPLKIIRDSEKVSAVGWLYEIEERQLRIEEEQKRINERLNEFDSDGVPLNFEE